MKICLDAGHYGKYNQSPVNPAYWESDFAWKFHLFLKAALEGYGIDSKRNYKKGGKRKWQYRGVIILSM